MDARLSLAKGVAVLTAALLAPATAAAEDEKVDATDDAEKRADPPKAKAAPPPEVTGFHWSPWGYLRLQYIAIQNDPNVQFVGRDDGFQLQNARIGVRGTWPGKANFMVAIDGAVDERDRINVPDGKLRVGLRDAFADVLLSESMVVRAGFFRTSTDTEPLLEIHRMFVDRGIESRGMRATEGFETRGLTAGRSLGAALRLEPGKKGGSPVGFEVAIQNGGDEFASNNDNDKPAVSAALLIRTSDRSRGTAGDALSSQTDTFVADVQIAGRYNPRSGGELPFREDEDDTRRSSARTSARAGSSSEEAPCSSGRRSRRSTGRPPMRSVRTHR